VSEQQPEPRPEESVSGQQPPPPYGQPGQSGAYGQPGQPGQPGPYGQYPQVGPAQGYSQELSPADQRMWAMLAHLGGIILGFVAPLIVYLVQKDRGIFVREQSREALNFQLTLLIAYVIASVIGVITFGIGFILYLPLVVLNILLPILAGVAANKGENYRYPLTVRMVS
jgi:uncharacterized Tic20 family protein